MGRKNRRAPGTEPETPPGADDTVPTEGFADGTGADVETETDADADTEPDAKADAGDADEKPKVRRTRTTAKADAGDADEKPPPPFGTARPAGKGALPRVIDPLERAGTGQTRFKIACRNYSPQKTRYVLAEKGDEDGAVGCYLAASGLDKLVARLKKNAGRGKTGEAKRLAEEEIDEPELVITELPD